MSGAVTDGPTFFIQHDPRWQEVLLAGEPEPWAAAAATSAWDVAGRPAGAEQLETFAAGLVSLAEYVRSLEPVLAFVFYPEPWAGPTTLVLVTAAPLPPGDARDAVLELVAVPEERHAEPQVVTTLETAAGEALRVLQRRIQDEQGRRVVTEHVFYAWPDPGQGLVLLASASFPDLLEAGRWGSAVDDLARGLTFGDD